MCELFGLCTAERVEAGALLREFFSHSVRHRNGWGMAFFYGDSVSIEKEPVQASESEYLRQRLSHGLRTRSMLAHIRLATIGEIEYANCHPFVRRDRYGHSLTLVHNGTIFDYPPLNAYVHTQEGRTDSERILCYLTDRICERQEALRRDLTAEERFALLEEHIAAMAPGNKLNLLLYDGETLYAHTNMANTLYMRRKGSAMLFATVPLDGGAWEPVPFTALCACREGKIWRVGRPHGHEYRENERDMRELFMAYAQL